MDFSTIFDTLQLIMTPFPVTKSGEKQNLALGLLVPNRAACPFCGPLGWLLRLPGPPSDNYITVAVIYPIALHYSIDFRSCLKDCLNQNGIMHNNNNTQPKIIYIIINLLVCKGSETQANKLI